jgi:hypothetical protein
MDLHCSFSFVSEEGAEEFRRGFKLIAVQMLVHPLGG